MASSEWFHAQDSAAVTLHCVEQFIFLPDQGLLIADASTLVHGGTLTACRFGFCVPRPRLLKRWLQAGVPMHEVNSEMCLVYPESAHDYEYYRDSTVAYFMVDDILDTLKEKLAFLK